MAVVGTAGVVQQVGQIAWLRWRLAVNALHTVRGKWELAARMIVGVFATLFALAIGGAVTGITVLVMKRSPDRIVLPLAGVFIAWMILPAVVSATSSNFEGRSLLRFPVRFSTYQVLSLSYSLFDPVALSALFWLGCVGAGIVTVRPALLPWVLLALSLQAVISILLSRLSLTWLEYLLSRQRTREILFIVFIFGMMSLSFVALGVERWSGQLRGVVDTVAPAAAVLPPMLAASVIRAGGQGRVPAAMALAGSMGLWTGLLLWLIRKRLLQQYRGEDSSEAVAALMRQAGMQEKEAVSTAAIWERWIPAPVAAMLVKETRYLFRNAATILILSIPFFLIAIMGMAMESAQRGMGFFQRRPEMMFPSAVAYTLFVVSPLAQNCFSFEGRGINLLYLLPVRFREFLLAKNAIAALVLLGQAFLMLVMIQTFFGAQQPAFVAATFSALIFAILVTCTLGNLLSLTFPRAFDFGSLRQRQSPVSVLLGMLMQLILFTLIWLVAGVAQWWGSLWAAVVAYWVLSAAMAQAYWLVLEYCEELARRKQETMLEELTRFAS
jgi:ABC-2 type transport system permease protein